MLLCPCDGIIMTCIMAAMLAIRELEKKSCLFNNFKYTGKCLV